MINLIKITESTRKDKRATAIIFYSDGKKKTIHFGDKNAKGKTYYDVKDDEKKENYIKRHKVNENWKDLNPGFLSRYVLWGERTQKGIKEDIKKNLPYKIKKIEIDLPKYNLINLIK